MSSESQIMAKPEAVQEVKQNGDNATAAKDKQYRKPSEKTAWKHLKDWALMPEKIPARFPV